MINVLRGHLYACMDLNKSSQETQQQQKTWYYLFYNTAHNNVIIKLAFGIGINVEEGLNGVNR